jgi:hypothetical protein
VDGRVEGQAEPLLVYAKEVLLQEKVPGAGDRQELGEALHDPEEYGFE